MTERRFTVFGWRNGAEQVQLFDARGLAPADIPALRAGEASGQLLCPTCQQPVRVLLAGEAEVVHLGTSQLRDHEPDDLLLLAKGKPALEQHLQQLFPAAVVASNAPMETGRIADVVMVTPTGGKMVVEIQSEPLKQAEIAAISQAYAQLGIACLWLLDIRQLQMTKRGDIMRKVTLGQLETALLANHQPLLYFDSGSQQLTLVQPNPQARRLAELGDRRIGRVESLVRHYPLSQLRVREAHWWLDQRFDQGAPRVPPLSDNLAKRLDRLQAKQRSS
jgi:hypothetical protein